MNATALELETTLSLAPDRCQKLGLLFSSFLGIADQTSSIPFTAPVLLLGDGQKELSLDFSMPKKGRVTLHEYQFIQRNQDLVSNQPLSISFAITPEVTPGNPFGFDARILDDAGESLCNTKTTLRSLGKPEISTMRGTNMPGSVQPENLNWQTSRPFTAQDITQYQALAGDNNPLHFDEAYAQSYGLAGPVVPGMLIAGLVEGVISKLHPDLRMDTARIRFLAPVYMADKARFGVLRKPAKIGGEALSFRVFVLNEADEIAAIADITTRNGK